jgi:hypothetical protein
VAGVSGRTTPSEIADEVNRRIRLSHFVLLFDYKRLRDDEHTFPVQSKKLRGQGFLNREDLYEFADWKSSRNPRLVLRNDDATVQQITRVALQLANDNSMPASVPIAVLTILEGVRVATASVILTVWDPTRFGIIDVNAWSALNIPAKRPGQFEPRDYDYYVAILRNLSEITKLTPRQIDMALWAWWKSPEANTHKKKAAA